MLHLATHFLPHFFIMQFNLTYMKRILHLVSVKNIFFETLPLYTEGPFLDVNFLDVKTFRRD